jgi:hypothetical protein
MPIVDDKPPDYPHLVHSQTPGTGMAIKREHVLWIVEDPRMERARAYPTRVETATRRKLVLKCACGDPKCSLRYEFTGHTSGRHPEKARQ